MQDNQKVNKKSVDFFGWNVFLLVKIQNNVSGHQRVGAYTTSVYISADQHINRNIPIATEHEP